MNQAKRFLHPIVIFVFSIVALAVSLFLYIYWYMEVSAGLNAIVQRFKIDPSQVLAAETWVVILVLSLLVGIILIGIFMTFVYNLKMSQLYRLQRNFISNFTHELKTPVTSLKLYLETFLKYDISRTDQLNYIGYMVNDVGRLSTTINRILNLAKIESKNFEGNFVNAELVQTVRQFHKSNNHLFQNCEITIHNPSQKPFPYRINPSLFEMLLMNLLTNALKYNESPVPVVNITFVRHANEYNICFQDNGIGIRKREIKKIFRKFYQVGQSDDMTAKGSGLGLYLVQNIARIHKGRVLAKSSGPGTGTTFVLILPIRPGRRALNQGETR